MLDKNSTNRDEFDTTNQSMENSCISSTSSSLNRTFNNYIQTICAIDKEKNLITLWSLEKFEYRLSILRDIYDHFMEEEESFTSSTLFNSNEYIMFVESNDKEWQSMESFLQNDETFSPLMFELFCFSFKISNKSSHD